MKNRKGLAWLFALFAVLSLLATACGSSDSSSSDKTTTTKAAADGGDTTTTAAPDTAGLDKLSGKLDGQGSSLQDTFEQQVSSDFTKAVSSAGGSAAVTYTKTGSGDGKKALADKTVGFAGTDSPIKDDEAPNFGSRKMLYFPLIGSPITVAFNVKGVDALKLSPETVAGIFAGTIKTWDDKAIAADNDGVDLPSTAITVVHRSDASGTTSNFTKYLAAAAPDVWKLTPGDTVEWPSGSSFQGAEKSTGVTSVVQSTDGAVTYADLADAAKAKLDVADIGDGNGKFVAPTPDGASAALAAAKVADDLTFNPLNTKADGAYPITSPTYILVDAVQKDAATAAVVKAYLNYVLTTGQAQAKPLLYAALPDALAQKAVDQLDQITAG